MTIEEYVDCVFSNIVEYYDVTEDEVRKYKETYWNFLESKHSSNEEPCIVADEIADMEGFDDRECLYDDPNEIMDDIYDMMDEDDLY